MSQAIFHWAAFILPYRYFLYSAQMTSTFKIRREELIHYFARFCRVDISPRHYKHISIVVQTGHVGNFRHPHQSSSDFLVLVQGHAYSLATATDSNSDFHVSAIYCLTQFMSIVWIVTTLFVKTAVVLVGVSFYPTPCNEPKIRSFPLHRLCRGFQPAPEDLQADRP